MLMHYVNHATLNTKALGIHPKPHKAYAQYGCTTLSMNYVFLYIIMCEILHSHGCNACSIKSPSKNSSIMQIIENPKLTKYGSKLIYP